MQGICLFVNMKIRVYSAGLSDMTASIHCYMKKWYISDTFVLYSMHHQVYVSKKRQSSVCHNFDESVIAFTIHCVFVMEKQRDKF